MPLSINETFLVGASPERVFDFLTRPADVVTCLPGAELTETIDERTYGGRVKIKVGPITAAYAGRATLEEVDATERRVRIVGEGKESGGPGSARMTLNARVTGVAGGGSEVTIDAAIDIVGRVMQFGRGLIESVSRQLFAQFVLAAQAKLAAPEQPSASARESPSTTGTESGGAPPLTVAAPPLSPNDSPGLSPGLSPGISPGVSPSLPGSADLHTVHPADRGMNSLVPAPPGAAVQRELNALPLLWKAFVSWLKGLLGIRR